MEVDFPMTNCGEYGRVISDITDPDPFDNIFLLCDIPVEVRPAIVKGG